MTDDQEHVLSVEAHNAVMDFAQAILHGDQKHRDWLLSAAHAFVLGQQPPPWKEDR